MKTVKTSAIVTYLHYRSILVLCTLLYSLAAAAQVKFETRVQDRKVGKDDPFRVEYVMENAEEVSSFQVPEFTDFAILQGPTQGQSTSIMNGKVSQYIFISYVLKARKTGKLNIPGACAVIGGKKFRSQGIQVEVLKGSTGRPPVSAVVPTPHPSWEDIRPARKELYLKPGENALDKIRDNLFVKAECDRYQCYVGEPVVATYKLYTRLQSESRVTKRPSLNGFSVYDMVDPESSHARKESLGGKEYSVYYIRKTQLYPLQAGKITLDPVEVDNRVVFYTSPEQQRPGRSMDDLVREFFNDVPMGEGEEHTLALSSKPMEINVLPLPEENKPAGFGGAVGKFSIHASLDANGIATGRSGTLVITLEGKGNFPMITAPSVQWPVSFDAFDPSAEEDVNKQDAPMTGTKKFKYVFTPADTGVFTIPAVHFSYFDPQLKKYQTIETAPVSLDVPMGVNYGKQDEAAESKELQHSMNSSTVIKILMGAALLLVLALGYITWNSRRKVKRRVARIKTVVPDGGTPAPALASTPVPAPAEHGAARIGHRAGGAAQHRAGPAEHDASRMETPSRPTGGGASKEASASLNEEILINWQPLEEMIAKGESKSFYQALGNHLWQFFSGKLSLSGSERNKRALVQKLSLAGIGADETALATRLLSDCELALYTPVHSEADMHTMLAESRQLLDRLSGKL